MGLLVVGCTSGGLAGRGLGGTVGAGGSEGGFVDVPGSGGTGGMGESGTLAGGGQSGTGGIAGSGTLAGGGQSGTGGMVGTSAFGGAGGAGGTAGTKVCVNWCAADFPCGVWGAGTPQCADGDPSVILIGQNVSCEKVCGTPCCTGGGCTMVKSSCASGSVCVYASVMSDYNQLKAECLAAEQTCGGPDNNSCPSGEYCEYFVSPCLGGSTSCPQVLSPCNYVGRGAAGVCQPLPSPSQCSALKDPVCGCDGVTYPDDCVRMAANTAQAHQGACP